MSLSKLALLAAVLVPGDPPHSDGIVMIADLGVSGREEVMDRGEALSCLIGTCNGGGVLLAFTVRSGDMRSACDNV